MPLGIFLTLLVTVLAAAGATVALIWVLGINVLWLGLVAVLLALLIRFVRW